MWNFLLHYYKDGYNINTSKINEAKEILKTNDINHTLEKLCEASWQGVTLKNRYADNDLILNGCFTWLTKWKDCPTEIINEIHSLYLQIIPTLSFTKYRGDKTVISTHCRLCADGIESVKHLLSNCQKILIYTPTRSSTTVNIV